MRPLDDVFSSSSTVRPKSSIASRSPSPGSRALGGGGGGGLTFFLTEENNFGVHSLTDSHHSSTNTSTSRQLALDAEIVEKPVTDRSKNGVHIAEITPASPIKAGIIS